jgi:hypothetical protein
MPILANQEYIPSRIVNDAELSSYYKVWIYSSISGGIVGYLPEIIDIGVESEWQAPFEQSGVSPIEAGAQAFGISTKFIHQTRMSWAGTQPLQITLPLTFFARIDAESEVLEPCKKLQKMCLPSIGDANIGNLIPPGPRWKLLSGKRAGGDNITIQIGNIIEINSVVFTNVTVSYSSILSKKGHPMKAVVNTTLMTTEVMTKDRI